MDDNVLDQWNLAAERYSASQKATFNDKFNREFVIHLLNDLTGCRVLDAGCGDGTYSQILMELGAAVTGCDGSSKMVEIAKQKFPDLQFDQVDLLSPLPYKDGSFDVIFSNMVLMDIDPIQTFVSEASRILKPNGKFLFSIVHPAFFTGDWEIDAQGRKRSKKVFDYLTCRKEENDFWGPTTHYHKPVSYYINIFSENGLLVDRMYEPIPSQKILNEQNERLTRIPIFLFVVFRKWAG